MVSLRALIGRAGRRSRCGGAWWLGCVLALLAPQAAADQYPTEQSIRDELRECARESSTAGKIRCRYRLFEDSDAFEAMPLESQEEELADLAEVLYERSHDSCREQWHDLAVHNRRAVDVLEYQFGFYKEHCSLGHAECTSGWAANIREAMDRYVEMQLQRAAIEKERGDEVGDWLAYETPHEFMTRSVLLTWERSLCRCDDEQLARCGKHTSRCIMQVNELCAEPDCLMPWCTYGTTLSDLGPAAGSLSMSLDLIAATGRCPGLGPEPEEPEDDELDLDEGDAIDGGEGPPPGGGSAGGGPV